MGSGDDERVRRLIAAEPGSGAEPEELGWLRRMCIAAARSVPGSGAGVSLMNRAGSTGLSTASDITGELIEELQFTLGEGPCRDAFDSREPVLAHDLTSAGTTDRWPAYGPAARGHGVEAVFAFPLQIGDACLGVLDVYRSRPGVLSPTAVAEASTFARVTVTRLLDADGAAWLALMGEAAEDDDRPGHRLEVHQAVGMVMARLGVGAEEAMLRLRAHAFAHDRRITEVAADVISRRLVLTRDRPEEERR